MGLFTRCLFAPTVELSGLHIAGERTCESVEDDRMVTSAVSFRIPPDRSSPCALLATPWDDFIQKPLADQFLNHMNMSVTLLFNVRVR